MAEKAYLDFYGKHGIIPVHQDIQSLDLHMARRRALFRHLGIHPLAFKGRSVIEFGPGTGDNALYTASCAPALYVLVDGNPASTQAISEKLERGLLPRDRVVCRQADIREYHDDKLYDIVLCEGVIPLQEDPAAFLQHVASFVGPGGLLVMTTMSPSSLLSESCRRVVKPAFTKDAPSEEALLTELVHFFAPDLQSLPGMSRRHEDWVLDNILYPWPARCTFTIPEAIETLDREFDILGASPSFVQDWRWYKSIPAHAKTWNDHAREEYDRWAGYLLDYRVQPGLPGRWPAGKLDAACQAAINIQSSICQNDSFRELPAFLDHLRTVREMVQEQMPETGAALADFSAGIHPFVHGSPQADFGSFRSWFGRGQQYASFTRKDDRPA